jgi:hypothetical protein
MLSIGKLAECARYTTKDLQSEKNLRALEGGWDLDVRGLGVAPSFFRS